MSKLSSDQMRTMRYGIHSVGTHVHTKLRYTAQLIHRMTMHDPELKPFLNDITVSYNKAHTHGHIAFIAHQNTGLVQLIHRVEKRQRHLIKQHELEMEQARNEHYADIDPNPEC
jgi:hypothetical protein